MRLREERNDDMMRKRFCTAALALLLMLVLLPKAHADAFVALGSVEAGRPVSLLLCQVNPDVLVTADLLPAGCEIRQYTGEAGSFLNLEGTPIAAGSYSFTVNAGERVFCSLDVTPAVPWVSITGREQCTAGEMLMLEAQAGSADGGSISYQWCSGVGIIALPIEGAVGQSYLADTSVPGTYFYSCLVTNTNNGMTSQALSDPIALTVSEPEVSVVSIDQMPLKTEYLVGETFEPAGMILRARYTGGEEITVTQGFTVEPAVFHTAGTQSVRVSFGGRSCGFNVTVKKPGESVTGIGVLTLPRKTVYEVGDSLETAGLSIRAYTADGGHFDISSGLDCSPTVFRSEGRQTVTVKYADKTCTFTVQVEDVDRVTGISVASLPVNREYTVGDYINTTGLTIQVNSARGSETVSSGFTFTPRVVTTVGTQTITVLYGQHSTTFSVNVKAKESPTPTPRHSAAPSPSAAPSAAPSADPGASPLPSPAHTPVPARRNTGVNAVVKVFFVIAVLALAGLVAYIWYLRRQGFADEGEYEVPSAKPSEVFETLLKGRKKAERKPGEEKGPETRSEDSGK